MKQCRILDRLKINKEEMSNPYKHIIINGSKVIMIDFERARFSNKVTNITQFFQYILKYNLIPLTEENKKLLKNYKLNPM